jgi:hypothetical protein
MEVNLGWGSGGQQDCKKTGRDQLSAKRVGHWSRPENNTELKHAEENLWSFDGSSHGCFQLEVWR